MYRRPAKLRSRVSPRERRRTPAATCRNSAALSRSSGPDAPWTDLRQTAISLGTQRVRFLSYDVLTSNPPSRSKQHRQARSHSPGLFRALRRGALPVAPARRRLRSSAAQWTSPVALGRGRPQVRCAVDACRSQCAVDVSGRSASWASVSLGARGRPSLANGPTPRRCKGRMKVLFYPRALGVGGAVSLHRGRLRVPMANRAGVRESICRRVRVKCKAR